MKELKNLSGIKELSKKEQKAIKGGLACLPGLYDCPMGYCCNEVIKHPGLFLCGVCA